MILAIGFGGWGSRRGLWVGFLAGSAGNKGKGVYNFTISASLG
jgi:hypothetical protein